VLLLIAAGLPTWAWLLESRLGRTERLHLQ